MKKIVTLTAVALVLTASAAYAANTMSSGRPSAVLNGKKCNEVWSKAVPKGDTTLPKAKARHFVVNFSQIDTDNDGTIDKKEFDAGCTKGLVKYRYH